MSGNGGKMNRMKRIALVAVMLVLSVTMVFAEGAREAIDAQKDIVILYTNDVHCGIDENIGYAGLAAYKEQMEDEGNTVVLIDAGDAVQGDVIGTVSRGSYLVDIMNELDYDYAVFGNHEFDYGMDRLSELVEKSDAQYLNATITYSGKNGNLLADSVPYAIERYGYLDVAFIGVSTPETLTKSTPKYFMEDGEFVYSFASGEELYATVQGYIDEVREKGADIVILITHLGVEEDSEPNRSYDLIANTTGADAVIDAHSHSVIESEIVKNRDGGDVILTQTGTKLANIGKMVIKADGSITTQLINDVEKDAEFSAYIDSIKAEYEEELNKTVAKSNVELAIKDETGARMVRNQETAIGDLCADAYRYVSGADIAFVNGGGIRAAIHKGDISTANIISVHPYGNMLCMCYATGQEILDALELGSMNTKLQKADNGNAVGESGGFLQVSGLKYTIDTSIPSSVVKDADGLFVEVAGERRVKDVYVEENGEWVAIDPEKTYTLACHNYKLQDMGDGYTMFADNTFILDKTMIDNQVLITYIRDGLGGTIGEEYAAPQGRITTI